MNNKIEQSQFINFKHDIDTIDSQSNELQLEKWNKLADLEKSEAWKQKRFYGNDIELYNQLHKLSFSEFIKEAFSIGNAKFLNTRKILQLPNGEKLFTKWGRENMVTYCNSTESEQIKILEMAEQSKTTPCFASIRAKIYPNKKRGKSIEIENVWKKKYEEIVIQLNELKEENKNLRLTIQTMMGVVKEEKKANAI